MAWGLAACAASVLLTVWPIVDFWQRLPELASPFWQRQRYGHASFDLSLITKSYLVEALLLHGLILLALYCERHRGRPLLALLWSALGAFSGLALMGAWSVAMIMVIAILGWSQRK